MWSCEHTSLVFILEGRYMPNLLFDFNFIEHPVRELWTLLERVICSIWLYAPCQSCFNVTFHFLIVVLYVVMCIWTILLWGELCYQFQVTNVFSSRSSVSFQSHRMTSVSIRSRPSSLRLKICCSVCIISFFVANIGLSSSKRVLWIKKQPVGSKLFCICQGRLHSPTS